ncbi:MAG: YraN family protein [Saprospiraceae bacterium]
MAERANQKRGKQAEDAACIYLQNEGFLILERNWRFSKAEIDIIAKDRFGILVFVEVKSRSYVTFGMPEESITASKENLIVDAAGQFMLQIGYDGAVRFDIISVIFQKMEISSLKHYPDAFFPGII